MQAFNILHLFFLKKKHVLRHMMGDTNVLRRTNLFYDMCSHDWTPEIMVQSDFQFFFLLYTQLSGEHT